jgi:hypothetical protein
VDSYLRPPVGKAEHRCMSEVDDELMQHVLRAVYRCLADDREGWGASHPQANRFMTALGMAKARDAMLKICSDVEADSEFVEFLDSHWLPRFRPLPT